MKLKPQSIFISGESGSGKTESVKYLLNFLCNVSKKASATITDHINKYFIESNDIFEVFGNASTENNKNSSRFFKLIKVYYKFYLFFSIHKFLITFRFIFNAIYQVAYNNRHEMIGGSVTAQLLESSRVYSNENNFHVFYSLLLGGSTELRAHLHLAEEIQFKVKYRR